MDKSTSLEQAMAAVQDGATILVGGFGFAGTPTRLIDALVDQSAARGLTVVSNNCGRPGMGLGRLLLTGRIRKLIGSFFTRNPDVARLRDEGKIEVELLPQGTIAESVRAAGAGIPAFFTPTGVGTELTAGKQVRWFDGRPYVLERALFGDVALIRAQRADAFGNLTYRKTARNFNPLMAGAAKTVIAEVDEVLPPGALPPEAVVTPHLFVDMLVPSGTKGGVAGGA